MQALWLEDGKLRFRDDLPQACRENDADAVVRIRLAGICGTDLALLRGYYPYQGIPGHEFVGEVVAASDATWLGRRVVGEINLGCGQCDACRRIGPQHCQRRRAVGIAGHAGAFAEYLTLPLANLHVVPDGLSDAVAVFTEPLAAALAILQQIHFRPDSRVLLIGAGRLGQLIAQVVGLTGAELSVVARYPVQRRLLADQGIATLAEDEVPAAQFDAVIEASGSPSGFALARRCVRPRGTVVLKSTYPEPVLVNLSALVVDEIKVIGSRCGPFAPALRLLAQGCVDPTPLICGIYPLQAGVEAFAAARTPDRIKVLLTPGTAYRELQR